MGLGPQPGPEFPPQLLLVYEALTWFDILLTPETDRFPSCDSRSPVVTLGPPKDTACPILWLHPFQGMPSLLP